MNDDPEDFDPIEDEDGDLITGGKRLGEESRQTFYTRLRESNKEKYRIQEKIAEGGMGAIFRVYDRCLRRTLVTKVILPHVAEDSMLFQRFVEEAQITGKLEHPNIVPVHDIGVMDNNQLYFSMKHVVGVSLGEILKNVRDGHQEWANRYSRFRLLTIFRKVCDAIAFAHANKVLHRDIKPDNIMVGDFGEVLVMDWGLAKRVDAEEDDFNIYAPEDDIGDVIKTRFGVVKGTPAFMSPEQAKGDTEFIDERSDIFLLGATLYAIATHAPPFHGDDIYEILANSENCNYIDPHLRAPDLDIPVELCRIINRAMAYDPEDRYQTVDDLSAHLDALLAGDTASVRKVFDEGDMIIEEGNLAEEAYVIISGQVEVFKEVRGKEVALITLGEGDVIGEMALISRQPRSASIRAIIPTEVVVITGEVMQQGLNQLPPWMGKIVDCLAERLRSANANVHPLMSGDSTFHVLQQFLHAYLLHGQPRWDSYFEGQIIAVPTELTIAEIAVSLCIAKDRVSLTIARLLESGMLKPCGRDQLVVPNYDLFLRFLLFCRDQQNITAGFGEYPETGLFAQPGEIVLRHSVPDAEEDEEAELTAVVCQTEEKVLHAIGEEAWDRFAEIHAKLQKLHSVPASQSVIDKRHR
jgi:eukaryotic-like serine/threonine-protein kinase